jgi:enoyl-CoA hydratase/carnithine racemase
LTAGPSALGSSPGGERPGIVRIDRDDGLAVVTFDSPPLNLYDTALHTALLTALDALESTPPRAVLFRAEGRAVSAGVDVSVFAAQAGTQAAAAYFDGLVAVARRVERLPCPTVFAAHALCLTWAFELALACDLIVAAASARFGLVERVIGLTPAMGGTQRLAERAGTGRARELVMTGELFDATTLERWNVVNRVLADEQFDAAARALAADLAAGPTCAHAATKRVLREYLEHGVDGADAAVGRIAGELFATEDLQNAVRSFLEVGPGKARFDGR